MDGKAVSNLKKCTIRLGAILLAAAVLAAFQPLTVRAAGDENKSGEKSGTDSQAGTQAPYLREEVKANPSIKKVMLIGETYELDLTRIFWDDDTPRSALTYYVMENGGGYQPVDAKYSYVYTGEDKNKRTVLTFKAGDGLHDSPFYRVILQYYEDPSRVPSLEWLRYKAGPAGVTIVECQANAPAVDIPDYIEGKPVTNIAAGAFDGCGKLTAITLPNTLKTIGNQAFLFCTALQKINLPEGLTQVGEEAFRNCTSLAEINIPAGLQELKPNIFKNCREIHFSVSADNPVFTGREGVIYDKEMTTLIRAGVIDSGRLTIPDSVTAISPQAFLNNGLKAITFGPNVKTIGDNAFQGCAQLEEAVLNQGLESIGASAFEGNAALRTISLPDSLVSLGKIVFRESGLEQINLASTGLTVLPYGTFYGCAQLRDINLGDRITVIEDSVFAGCQSLQEITLPAKLRHLGGRSFSGCSLESVRLPYTLKKMGSFLFSGCGALKSVYFEGNMPLRGDGYGTGPVSEVYPRENDSFSGLPLAVAKELKIYVLKGARGWGDSFRDYADGSGASTRREFEYKVSYYVLDELKEEQTPRVILHSPASFAGLETGSVSEPVNLIKAGLPPSAGPIEWSSSDSSVAAVDASGRVTALAEGLSVITASLTVDGTVYTGQAEVNVIGPTIFDWKLQNDGTVIINGFKEGADDGEKMPYLEIPERLAGYPVTAIRDSAFKMDYTIFSVRIPGSVKAIGNYAFYYCIELREVTLEEGIERIGNAAFQGTAIREIVIPGSVVASEAGVNTGGSYMTDVFRDCRQLETAIVEADNLEYLTGTFRDCTSLKNVTLGEGLKNIGGWCFAGCTSLESITLPASLQQMGGYDFSGCTSLKTVEFQSYLLAEDPDTSQFEHYDRVFQAPYENYWTEIHYQDCGEDLVVIHPADGNDWGSLFNNTVKTGVRTSAGGVRLDGFSALPAITGSVAVLNAGTVVAVPWDTVPDTASAGSEGPAGEEKTQSPDGKEATTVFEIVKKAVAENPLLIVSIGVIVLAVLFLGGARRYKQYRKNQ